MAGQTWSTAADGGYLANPKLSEKLRFAAYEQARFRQFCNVKEEIKQKGETMNFDKILKLATGGGTLVETDTVPSDKFTISKGTITVTEYGNKIPFTGKLETLSEFDVKNPVQKRLRDDIKDVLDAAAGAQFTAAEFKAVLISTSSVNFTTDGTASTTATANLHTNTVRQIVSYMKKKNIPFYDSNGYVCIGGIDAIASLYDAFQALIQYTKPELMFSGEVGRYYSCRFVEENNVLDTSAGNSAYCEAVFLGDDAVMEGIAMAEELRADTPSDLGRSKAIGWLYLGGFKKVWSYATDEQENIVHVTSA
jgi:N4-gp56 family major capsid protein